MIIHFSALILYSNPFNLEKTKPGFYAQAYIYPYFHQNWNLFAPVPDSNYNLYCEYENNGLQKTDIFKEIETLHQSNRLKGYEPLLVAFANSIHYFEKNTNLQSALNGPIVNDLNFKIIENATKNYLEYSRKIALKKVKIILAVKPIGQKQKFYFN